jgi:hypothetical protein
MTVDASWLKATRARADADLKMLRQLTAQREQLDTQIAALSERVRSWQVILDSMNGSAQREETRRPPAEKVEALETAQDVGLRATIREVLSAAPGGLRPKDVTARLKARGFSIPGTSTALGVRVGAELWKMMQIGQLRKVRGGYTVVKPETADSGETA